MQGHAALAFSLPVKDGGHRSFLPRNLNAERIFLDVTMLAADMGVEEIDGDHPDAQNFLPRQFKSISSLIWSYVTARFYEHMPALTIVRRPERQED